MGLVVAHPVGGPVDLAGHAAVQQTIQHRGGDCGVVEDSYPTRADPDVGGQDDAALEVALRDQLESRGSCLSFHGQVAQLVNDEEPWSGVEAHSGFPSAFDAGFVASGGQFGGGGVVGAVAGVDRRPAKGGGQHRPTDTICYAGSCALYERENRHARC